MPKGTSRYLRCSYMLDAGATAGGGTMIFLLNDMAEEGKTLAWLGARNVERALSAGSSTDLHSTTVYRW